MAAYGPFVVSVLMNASFEGFGSPAAFFVGAIAFYALATGINWWYYARKGAEVPC